MPPFGTKMFVSPACQSRAERIRRSFLSSCKLERRAYREILQQSSYWSGLLRQERVEVLFWSSLKVVYDSGIEPFQGHPTSPAPPFPPSGSGTEEILWQPEMMPNSLRTLWLWPP